MKRRHIVPGSVRIFGLPNTDRNFGIRDNGSGQMWSQTSFVGTINYWTGEVVLNQKYVPKTRLFDGLRDLFGLKDPKHDVSMEYECEYKVSLLDIEAVKELHAVGLSLTGDLTLIGERRY